MHPPSLYLLTSVLLATLATATASADELDLARATPARTWKLQVAIDPLLIVGGGFGGTVGVEHGRWRVGVAGFAVPLGAAYRDLFLEGAQNLDIKRNWGVEAMVDVYLTPKGRWLFAGLMASLDGFDARAETGETATAHALYLVPRVGLHWRFLQTWGIDRWYVEPVVGVAVTAWSDSPAHVGNETLAVRAAAPLWLLSLGASF